MLEQHIPRKSVLHKVLTYGKPLSANILLFLLALEMLVFSLTFMMAIGNSFYIYVSDSVFGAINLFFCLTIVWYLFTELFLCKYIEKQFGFYVGVLVASIILVLPLIRYEAVFVAAKVQKVVAINISVIPVLAALCFLLRVGRVFWWHSTTARYGPLPTAPARLSMKKVRFHKKRHTPTNPAVMEEESEEDIFFEQ